MNVLKISLLSAAILACPSFKAQETQRLTADKLNEYGILYSLPITHLNIEVEAVKTVKKAGPYARYAEKFLGVKGAILADSQSWEIKDVSISSYGVPDLNNQWLAKFKSGTSTFMIIDDSGLPLALNAEPEMAVVERKASLKAPTIHRRSPKRWWRANLCLNGRKLRLKKFSNSERAETTSCRAMPTRCRPTALRCN